ncbi:PBECR2 nuclease fold domain-containing protein [Rhodoferax sp. BLA1]|uniref:PBECR2 nuclease fold domain-containing protein n=1 Tax=Rhodoferax sp. BLA1 TaxID=2576062 RepID=UPI0015D402DA|nr:PBECR2 nuclease fold domain-containing protein [Rhodoferax sp. BLA1]
MTSSLEGARDLIKHRDVTGVLVHFTQQDIFRLANNMEPEQRRELRVVAETITTPSEIWQQWVRDPKNSDGWVKKRTYLRVLRTVEQELTGDALGIAVEFIYSMRWELSGVHLLPSSLVNVSGNMDEVFRQGDLMYSAEKAKHPLGTQ